MILPLGLSALRQYHLAKGFINHNIAQKEVLYSVKIKASERLEDCSTIVSPDKSQDTYVSAGSFRYSKFLFIRDNLKKHFSRPFKFCGYIWVRPIVYCFMALAFHRKTSGSLLNVKFGVFLHVLTWYSYTEG